MKQLFFSAPFDQIKTRDLRLLQEAARLGEVTVLLWPDGAVATQFPYAERHYLLAALRFVNRVETASPEQTAAGPACWLDAPLSGPRQDFPESVLAGLPDPPSLPHTPGVKKVVVTGCYDWLHSGHIAFFEEAAALGELTVCLGNDANVRRLKGAGHPLFPQEERRYNCACVRHVRQAMVSTGSGWMDAEHEILHVIKPDIYVVNADGHKPEKADFCARHGIEYQVLERRPKEGLPARSSTALRGF